MTVLLVGDVHLSDKPPRNRTEDYTLDIFAKLGLIFREAAQRDIEKIVFAGDLFHIKTPSRNSHNLVRATIELFDNANILVEVVPGNHDMQYDRLDSVWDGPLGVVFASGNATLCKGWDTPHFEDDSVYGVPWLQAWDDASVRKTLEGYAREGLPGLVVTHAPLFPPGKEPPYEYYDVHKFAEYMGNVGCVFYGHIHDPHGIYEVDGVTFCNMGALSRGSLTESEFTRKIYCTSWNLDEGFTPIEIPSRPAKEVFLVEQAEVKANHKANFNAFLDLVGSAEIDNTSEEQILAHVKSMNLDESLVELIKNLLSEASDG